MILLRGGDEALEVLLVKRTPQARFMGGVWVFPGGAVDARSRATATSAHRAAAVRELREEAAIALADPGELVEFSRWITPAEVQIRFDTHFFLAALPDGQEPRVDGEECVDLGWFTPQAALDAHAARARSCSCSPRSSTSSSCSAFASVDELLDYARGREVLPVQPRVVLEGEVARVLLPGEPGY